MAIWNKEANLILVEATKIADANERSLFVKERCAGDEELHSLVLELLASEEALSGFLEEPAITNDFAPQADPRDGLIGTEIDGYKILEQLGEGGFGTVYMAQQKTPVRRKVALKVIKPGMDTREVITRFEAERQALAMMNHPNISRVFDAGTTSTGHPYFVMELVRGVPITDFCETNSMGHEERLELVASVCHAIQHAHQRGIIHRDIKPSNVMVSMLDGKPVAKVIDFGIAKAIDQELTEKTLFTRFGRMVGTPHYMSPEQAGHNWPTSTHVATSIRLACCCTNFSRARRRSILRD